MMRPSTEGCTEWTCVYHGSENRAKAEHADDCPVRAMPGFRVVEKHTDPSFARCTCMPTPPGYPEGRLPGEAMPRTAHDALPGDGQLG